MLPNGKGRYGVGNSQTAGRHGVRFHQQRTRNPPFRSRPTPDLRPGCLEAPTWVNSGGSGWAARLPPLMGRVLGRDSSIGRAAVS